MDLESNDLWGNCIRLHEPVSSISNCSSKLSIVPYSYLKRSYLASLGRVLYEGTALRIFLVGFSHC